MVRRLKPRKKYAIRLGLIAEEESKGPAHERKHQSRKTDYGRELDEKQKLKFIYGITERQLRRYVAIAKRSADPVEALLQRLEGRLDNIVFRLGFAKTREHARQLVTHGHVRVNDKRLSVPSAEIGLGDRIALSERMYENAIVRERLEAASLEAPPLWLERSEKGGTVRALPKRGDVIIPVDLSTVVTFYQ